MGHTPCLTLEFQRGQKEEEMLHSNAQSLRLQTYCICHAVGTAAHDPSLLLLCSGCFLVLEKRGREGCDKFGLGEEKRRGEERESDGLCVVGLAPRNGERANEPV